MITLKMTPDQKVIELGGGSNPIVRPNVDVRMCYDSEGKPTVDFTADFNQDLPIQSDEWDGVFAQYVIEHLSWRSVRKFLQEVHRILKNGGKAVFVTANTDAQIEWIKKNPNGWDGKDAFDSYSCVIFGDQDYPENSHRNFMNPSLITSLLNEAGFMDVKVQEYGERFTDMVVQATKSAWTGKETSMIFNQVNNNQGNVVNTITEVKEEKKEDVLSKYTRKELYDKDYFNGGGKVGGYSREGYWDYPVHEVTTNKIIAHIRSLETTRSYRDSPKVLELGSARGYIVKRLQDRGFEAYGMEISEHCYLTRVTENIIQWDMCKFPWPFGNKEFDLVYSIATLEHIPQEFLSEVVKEIERISTYSLHGIDFGEKDDGFDKTHCSLYPKTVWEKFFADKERHTLLNKEELESGDFPLDVFQGDGKIKLNIGSFTTMYHYGWLNIDILDLSTFANQYHYKFKQHDVRTGLPFETGSVHMISSNHFLEHLTYKEGLSFLRECRRVLKPASEKGLLRLAVPDLLTLMTAYRENALNEFDQMNDGCNASTTEAERLWSLLMASHQAIYDFPTLAKYLKEAGFMAVASSFRTCSSAQMLRETVDMVPCLSLYMDAFPA